MNIKFILAVILMVTALMTFVLGDKIYLKISKKELKSKEEKTTLRNVVLLIAIFQGAIAGILNLLVVLKI